MHRIKMSFLRAKSTNVKYSNASFNIDLARPCHIYFYLSFGIVSQPLLSDLNINLNLNIE